MLLRVGVKTLYLCTFELYSLIFRRVNKNLWMGPDFHMYEFG